MVGQQTVVSFDELSDQQFSQWRSVFQHMTGLQLAPEREPFVKSVLLRRAGESGCRSVDHYLQQLHGNAAFSRREWDELIDQVVINETRFFRYPVNFAFLSRYIADILRKSPTSTDVKAWSVGCSSGEEAYSLAMTIFRCCKGNRADRQFSVVGTDINPNNLKVASRGVYRNIIDRGITEAMAARFFETLGNGSYRIKSFIKSRVAFLRHNMLEPVTTALIPDMDIISCQNVLMYFQPWRRRSVIRHLASSLKVGGVLVLCPGDLGNWKPENLERVKVQGVSAYRRIA